VEHPPPEEIIAMLVLAVVVDAAGSTLRRGLDNLYA
jgi:hypothetical protein